LHAPVRVRMSKTIDEKTYTKLIECTVGRIIFNDPIPQDLGYIDRNNTDNLLDLEISFLVRKKELGKIIDRCIRAHGTTKTSEVLDFIKAQGFKYSTKGAITVAVCDALIPTEKKQVLEEADKQVDQIKRQYDRGFISEEVRYERVIKTWNEATAKVKDALNATFGERNPIFMMADSGARGSMDQIRQLAGMRGLIANTSGRAIEIPIRSNYREGLNILEYFNSARGARKGLADTALRTADSGYLTRRLVDVSQDVIIRHEDCGTTQGIWVSEICDGSRVVEGLDERLLGRYLTEDCIDPSTGNLLVSKEKMMDEFDAKKIIDAGYKKIKIRSILNCESKFGVCA
ncbi:MAG: DNA-directed RNA polymerase subunit beta', partial [Oscillospiraceae bacterium]